jgi:hypothetical protein
MIEQRIAGGANNAVQAAIPQVREMTVTSALQELNDDSTPEPGRVTAKQRIKQFLIASADKIGDAAAGVLQTYVEKKLLGM